MSQAKTKETSGDGAPRAPMNIKDIKNLVELMVAHDLSRIELREGDTHVLLRRGQPIITAAPPLPTPVAPPLPAAAPVPNPAGAAPAVPAPAENEILIRSPMVGTVYHAADPESPPLVTVGSQVTHDTVVCLIEAMKVFNEIKSECTGQITKILVKNAQAVEYDQPLFAVRPA